MIQSALSSRWLPPPDGNFVVAIVAIKLDKVKYILMLVINKQGNGNFEGNLSMQSLRSAIPHGHEDTWF